MRAGKLRHRVQVQENQGTVQNAAGQEVENWQTTATVWAAVEPGQGREFWQAKATQVLATVSHAVTLRYGVTVTPKHRLKLGTRVFSIEAVLNQDERDRELRLLCTEKG